MWKRYSREILVIIIILVGAALITMLGGCVDNTPTAQEKNEAARDSLMERATAKVPVPRVNNFLTRQYVAEWMERMDNPSKVFYIYLLADTGNMIGYYTGTRPVSLCTLMTPPKKWWYEGGATHTEVLGPANTLSGVYGSGSGGCDTYYFFDEQSDALVHFSKFKYFVSDQPLNLKADPINVVPPGN